MGFSSTPSVLLPFLDHHGFCTTVSVIVIRLLPLRVVTEGDSMLYCVLVTTFILVTCSICSSPGM